MFKGINFTQTEFLWLLILVPILVLWYVLKNKKQTARLSVSSVGGFQKTSIWTTVKHLLFGLRIIAIILVICALARPQTVDVSSKTKTTRGVDIVMAIDVSASMLAKDLKPNRLEALKNVAADFIKGRPNDRLVSWNMPVKAILKHLLQATKTLYYSQSLKNIRYNSIITGGTAIGMGLATAVNRIKDSRAKSKIIILLTDG